MDIKVRFHADEEREGDLSWVKNQMSQIEVLDEEEGFAHVYVVNEEEIQRCTKILSV